MGEERKPKEDAVELFLHADRKIEKIVGDVTDLVKKDLGLDHKMDMVLQQQNQLKERFDHSSQTGHKTWEAMQQVVAAVEKMTIEKHAQDKEIEGAINLADKVDRRFDKMFYGIFAVVFLSIFAAVMSFLWNYRGIHP